MSQKLTAIACSILWSGAMLAQTDTNAVPGEWPIAGQNLSNSRGRVGEQQIGTSNVGQLVTRWVFETGADVSATPTVAGNTVYFPDWAGNLFAVNAETGELRWSHQISAYNGRPGSVSRVSPAVFENELIIGDNVRSSMEHDGAHVLAVDRDSGKLLWITQVDAHPAAVITGSPVFNGSVVYVGVSSNEEGLASDANYVCCTFRGSMVALNASTGAVLWKTFVVPDNKGQPNAYSGGAIWQPPAIDPLRGSLFIGTGNNYTVPKSVLDCQQAAVAAGNPNAVCTSPDDHFDAALALDLNTGAIKWATGVMAFDAWTVACIRSLTATNCPEPSGPDFDLGGSGPNLLANMVGFGQKSGAYWALNPDNGKVLWATKVGPGSTLGGIEWGTATDGLRIYVAVTNASHVTFSLPGGAPTSAGTWAALDAATGRMVWQIADPKGAIDMGSLSVANGVLYAPSFSGFVYGLEALTGKILFQYDTGGSVIDGPSIVDGSVYWGSGYQHISPGVGNNKVFAFNLPAGNGQ